MTKLWKYNKITGYWNYVRECKDEHSQDWLKLFQDDEPEEIFKLSKIRPSKNPLKRP